MNTNALTSPIPYSSLFATPDSLEALDEQIRQLPQAQRTTAYLYTMLAFNLAHKLTRQAEEAC